MLSATTTNPENTQPQEQISPYTMMHVVLSNQFNQQSTCRKEKGPEFAELGIFLSQLQEYSQLPEPFLIHQGLDMAQNNAIHPKCQQKQLLAGWNAHRIKINKRTAELPENETDNGSKHCFKSPHNHTF